MYPPLAAGSEQPFEYRRNWFLWAFISIAVMDILQTWARGGIFSPWYYLPFVLHYILLALIGILVKNPLLHRYLPWYFLISLSAWSFNDGPEHLYISFDIDVIDPAFTPGTGTPEPGGLMPREVFPQLRTLCSENNLVGFDLVELNPLVDPGYITVLNSNMLVQECLTGIAMRKKGVTERGYHSPLTVGDGQDDPQDR